MEREETAASSVESRSEVSCEITAHASPTVAVATAIAELTGTNPTEIPCLYEYVNTDALDALIETHGSRESTLSLTVTVESVAVTVDGTNSVTARPLTDSTDATATIEEVE